MKKIIGIFLVIFCLCFSMALAASQEEWSAEEWFNQGNQYYVSGEYTNAIAAYTKSIEIDPYTTAYGNRGVAYGKLNQFGRAIEDYTKAIEIDPQDAKAYYNRGNVYSDFKQFDQAIEDYTKVIELNPNMLKLTIIAEILIGN